MLPINDYLEPSWVTLQSPETGGSFNIVYIEVLLQKILLTVYGLP